MRLAVRVMAMAAVLALLLLAWWGWQQGGLALMQLGMAIC
ncbi:hypothetical protein PFLU3_54760 [Pseudomonas fluorescens]|uniref:Uncharacterized protein n=1 Tax=Pseudomonas fluorescens TaxID=294 RepID=A0A0D0T2U6_PSEFL|nr:hypothetical protein C4K02_4141 [Pseudomonas synxantha]KIR15480.1 hypothetical protein PFLU3_54760 [Pseudomonas fluorescens]